MSPSTSAITVDLYGPDRKWSSEPFFGHNMLVDHGGALMFAQWHVALDFLYEDEGGPVGWWRVHQPDGTAAAVANLWPQGCVFLRWDHSAAPDTDSPIQPATDGPLCDCGEGILTPALYQTGVVKPIAPPWPNGRLISSSDMVCSSSGETFPVKMWRASRAWWSCGACEQLAWLKVNPQPAANPYTDAPESGLLDVDTFARLSVQFDGETAHAVEAFIAARVGE